MVVDCLGFDALLHWWPSPHTPLHPLTVILSLQSSVYESAQSDDVPSQSVFREFPRSQPVLELELARVGMRI